MSLTNAQISLPRYIGLCGHPKAGKSLVQDILHAAYGVNPVDDGGPLREFAINSLGFTYEDAYTQEGKARTRVILGKEWQNRKILGELGNALESLFGEHIVAFMAVERAKRMPGKHFSFGSVRRDQGLFFKQQDGGALILGIENPLATPSPYEFDRFDRSVVDIWINNDGLARGLSKVDARADLETKIWAALTSYSLRRRTAA